DGNCAARHYGRAPDRETRPWGIHRRNIHDLRPAVSGARPRYGSWRVYRSEWRRPAFYRRPGCRAQRDFHASVYPAATGADQSGFWQRRPDGIAALREYAAPARVSY